MYNIFTISTINAIEKIGHRRHLEDILVMSEYRLRDFIGHRSYLTTLNTSWKLFLQDGQICPPPDC